MLFIVDFRCLWFGGNDEKVEINSLLLLPSQILTSDDSLWKALEKFLHFSGENKVTKNIENLYKNRFQ